MMGLRLGPHAFRCFGDGAGYLSAYIVSAVIGSSQKARRYSYTIPRSRHACWLAGAGQKP
jgi:hypothetical protein